MQRWEYCEVYWTSDGSVALFHRRNPRDRRKHEAPDPEALVAELGEDGWELVSVGATPDDDEERWIFKRPFG